MMVPRSPLLWAAGLWLVPFNLAMALDPAQARWCLPAMLSLPLLAAWDALRLRERLRGLQVEAAPSLRFVLGKPSALPFRLRGSVPTAMKILVTVELPSLLSPALTAQQISLPPGQGDWGLSPMVTPRLRGRARIPGVTLATASYLGFWSLRRSGALDSEIRVYPGLGGRSGRMALPDTLPLYGHRFRRKMGKGREFDKLREYLHGDDYHDIHWKATAKRGHPVTKTFHAENTQQVYAILDVSRLSSVPIAASGTTKPIEHEQVPMEYFLRAALRLGVAAERQGDHYGLMLYAEQPLRFLRASKGRSHYGAFRDALFGIENSPLGPDYAEVFTAIRLRLRKRALLVFFCSLDEPALAESFAAHIGLISSQHLVSVVGIRPPDLLPPFQGAQPRTDEEVYCRLADQIRLRGLDKLARELRRQGVAFRCWEPERLSAEAISQYLESKYRSAAA
ncbi:MAG: DUF58 domain-containing protein [Fibrobacteria bacterium]